MATKGSVENLVDTVTKNLENMVIEGPDTNVEEKRLRKLTQKAKLQYESDLAEYINRIDNAWSYIEDISLRVETLKDIKSLRQLRDDLDLFAKKYFELFDNFLEFLARKNTAESLEEIKIQQEVRQKARNVVEKLQSQIREARMEVMETMSTTNSKRSTASGSTISMRSNTCSMLMKKRIKAEAQHAKLKFVQQEVDMHRQKASLIEFEAKQKAETERKKAELEARMLILQQERETAILDAEVKAIEGNSIASRDTSPLASCLDEPVNRDELTESYVQNCLQIKHKHVPVQNEVISSELVADPMPLDGIDNTPTESKLNPCAASFKPATANENNDIVSGLTKFLLKKDLLLNRFSKFNDQPEAFAMWKATFCNIVQELSVTPFEEMDLLVKWLGTESSNFASSIRASNIGYPERGLRRIWDRLEERYGCCELVESSLKTKLNNFPKLSNRDNKKLYELADLLSQIESTKENPKYATLLSYFDTSSGILPIVNKLPHYLQEKWTSQAFNYKKQHNVPYPPFTFFVRFIQEYSRIRNDPGFHYEPAQTSVAKRNQHTAHNILSRKTDLSQIPHSGGVVSKDVSQKCPIHKLNHPVWKCRVFKSKTLSERKKVLRSAGICFRCCVSLDHMARDCNIPIKCDICGSDRHHSALHVDNKPVQSRDPDGGEPPSTEVKAIDSKCTQVCGDNFKGKSCAKIVLVRVFLESEPNRSLQTYAIVDDQSSGTLAKSALFDYFQIDSELIDYSISSCSGIVPAVGRQFKGLVVQSLDGTASLRLPNIIECNSIPDSRDEIPTPEVANNYEHLKDIMHEIPPLDNNASILLLIGRDLAEAHHVLDQKVGITSPYAQKLHLGWVIVGESCLDRVHPPDTVVVNKTYLLSNGRPSLFKPCENSFDVNETISEPREIGSDLFVRTSDDNKPGLSVTDREFLSIMGQELVKEGGKWVAPLPFLRQRQRLPNNRSMAFHRAVTLEKSFERDPVKKDHFFKFMEGILSNNYAELAPLLKDNEECWYLPIFGVYNAKKPGKIRVVFDSSAKFHNICLNDVLLSGPDLANSLIGVLMRFRKEQVAITADIEQMFFRFVVADKHRNYLRFFWHRNNNPLEDLVEYRMTSHVFGNTPSPAVATYGLRKSACSTDVKDDVKYFVNRNFYVDDALTSVPSPEEAIDLMKRTQIALYEGGCLRLHKIASNNIDVIEAFPVEDRSADLQELDLSFGDLPMQRSLGVSWNLQRDSFSFQLKLDNKPFTRRGILSTLNTVYDPLGFAAPVILEGRILFRQLVDMSGSWDDPLPVEYSNRWNTWTNSLSDLANVEIMRPYVPFSVLNSSRREIHVFSDASQSAVAAVSYLKATSKDNQVSIGFLFGKSKLAPKSGHTIPRLELCSAVLATEIVTAVLDQLDVSIDEVYFYTDSQVVLGYLYNRTRRFYTYVSNRVDKILNVSTPTQWRHIQSQLNPADVGTRGVLAKDLQSSIWLYPPPQAFYTQVLEPETSSADTFPLIDPNGDAEVRPETVLKLDTLVKLGSCVFEKYSTWKKLVTSIAILKEIAQHKSFTIKYDGLSVTALQSSESFVIREIQREAFANEISKLRLKECIPKTSSILSLNPYVDSDGLLRVGGRLRNSVFSEQIKNPIIIPKSSHVATLLIRHFHQKVYHQGRHVTEGRIRAEGYWIIGGKRLISAVINSCVICRKLRGQLQTQIMADLPASRTQISPPFTYVGLDVFGHWNVVTRKTRGGSANSKRWAVLFTCCTTRAIHIEIIENMSTSCFINALRRFVSIRGKVLEFRSDRGTNFVGSTDNIKANVINVKDSSVQKFLLDESTRWVFNPPHASHFGGIWERMIGIVRRILDCILLQAPMKHLTHEVLITFMAEVCAIVNSRPIVNVSSDPDNATVLSPSVLLTQKTGGDVAPFCEFDIREMYTAQWKHVQILAEMFWKRWKEEYIHTLQSRPKWKQQKNDIKQGDIVLLRDKQLYRNDWPVGVITKTFPSSDSRVRKVELRLIRNGQPVVLSRPINEIVLLHSPM